MFRPYRTDDFPLSSEDLEPIPGLTYSQGELFRDEVHSSNVPAEFSGTVPIPVPSSPGGPRFLDEREPGFDDTWAEPTLKEVHSYGDARPVPVPPPRRARGRSPTPIREGTSRTRHFYVESDSCDSDEEFEEITSSLTLDIRADAESMEKWSLSPGGSVRDFIGNGWKVQLAVSYTSPDLDLERLIRIMNVKVDCALAAMPRDIPATARKFRTPPRSYTVSYNGAMAALDNDGNLKMMDPTRGIYIDRDWSGPKRLAHKRRECSANVYIPIPAWIFSVAETRTFNIEVRVWVSVANQFPLILRSTNRINLTNFVAINARDGSERCVLLA